MVAVYLSIYCRQRIEKTKVSEPQSLSPAGSYSGRSSSSLFWKRLAIYIPDVQRRLMAEEERREGGMPPKSQLECVLLLLAPACRERDRRNKKTTVTNVLCSERNATIV